MTRTWSWPLWCQTLTSSSAVGQLDRSNPVKRGQTWSPAFGAWSNGVKARRPRRPVRHEQPRLGFSWPCASLPFPACLPSPPPVHPRNGLPFDFPTPARAGHSHTFLQTPNTTGPIFDKTSGATRERPPGARRPGRAGCAWGRVRTPNALPAQTPAPRGRPQNARDAQNAGNQNGARACGKKDLITKIVPIFDQFQEILGRAGNPKQPKTPPAAANCLKQRACDEPEGPFPTYVTAKSCAGQGAQEAAKCVTKVVPVVQAFFASKWVRGGRRGRLWTSKLGLF